ncbi:hypothetical protein BJX99DRAFT_185919 [Aspergillus californicus]
MATVNQNMFDACVGNERPQGPSMLVLPLNLIAQIVSSIDDAGDLARLCQTCRVLNYMALPQLYRNLTLTSYDKIRYRGDMPEGMGSASPFTMGLNAVITRPYASLVRSLTLRGDWREQELEEHARVGRVPDSSMMLNIAVRAAVDRMQDLESFRWELSTKMLETVYLGLAQSPKLTSLTLRFPSSRHPRPTIVIPAIPHLRYLKITDIDPLCYPDDISTLLFKARKLKELKMHWSPRMRNMQEPSVMVHDYFRKCISAKQPLTVKKFGMSNMYARHSEDFNTAFDHSTVEEVTILHESRSEGGMWNTFVDSTWPVTTPHKPMRLKTMRVNIYNQRQSEFLGSFVGLERLYLVGTLCPSESINSPREPAPSATTLTPPASDHTTSTSSDLIYPSSADSPSSLPALQARIRDTSLNSIIINHAATLKHLLLPARWPISSQLIARIVHASPQLEQLGFAAEVSSMDTLGLLLPFLRNLQALRLLVPTGAASSGSEENSNQHNFSSHTSKDTSKETPQTFACFVDLDDEILIEKLSEALADQHVFRKLKVLGFGRKAFLLGDLYTVPADHVKPNGLQSQTPAASRATSAEAHQDKSPQSYGDPEQENITAAGQVPGLLSPTPNHTQTNSPRLPHSFHPKTAHPKSTQTPPSTLGKRTRDDDLCVMPSGNRSSFFNQTLDDCLLGGTGNRTLRRRMQRVGWDVLKQWEIWGLDTQEL